MWGGGHSGELVTFLCHQGLKISLESHSPPPRPATIFQAGVTFFPFGFTSSHLSLPL